MLYLIANAGVPLMLATWAHLTIGCIVIAAAEAGVLRAFARVGFWRALGILALANLASAWLGMAWLLQQSMWIYEVFFSAPLIRAAWPIFCILFVAAFALSAAVEWPFVRWAGAKSAMTWSAALRWSVVVHMLSYPALALWYSNVSSLSLYTRFHSDDKLAFVDCPANLWVWFIRTSDGAICRVRPNGKDLEVVLCGCEHPESRVATPRRYDEGCWELWLLNERGPQVIPEFVLSSTSEIAALQDLQDYEGSLDLELNESLRKHSRTSELASAPSNWEGRRSSAQLTATVRMRQRVRGHERVLAFESPMFHYEFIARYLCALPGDYFVVQLGEAENAVVMIVDAERRITGVLAEGRAPFVSADLMVEAGPLRSSR